MYNLLLNEEENPFEGWKIEPGYVYATLPIVVAKCSVCLIFSVTFKDQHNQEVVSTLIREVKALNPPFLTQHIRGKVYLFVHNMKYTSINLTLRGSKAVLQVKDRGNVSKATWQIFRKI